MTTKMKKIKINAKLPFFYSNTFNDIVLQKFQQILSKILFKGIVYYFITI